MNDPNRTYDFDFAVAGGGPAGAGGFWLIQIDDRLTSAGVVVPRSIYMALPHGSPDEMLVHELAVTPLVAELLRDAAAGFAERGPARGPA